MNSDIQRFFERNNIDIRQVSSNVDCRVYSEYQINEISERYAVRQKQQETEVCIADILGYRDGRANIFLTMGDFFDSQGDGYHRRSIGMLDYSSDEIMWQLADSLEREPIVIDDTGEGKYVVSSNGLHRYTVFRAHYLSELEKCHGDPKKQLRLREKYMIPVKINELDHIKTYSKFLLTRYNPNIKSIRSEWNENYKYTGKMSIRYSDGKEIAVDDKELIGIVRETMLQQQNFDDLQKYFKYDSFKQFVEQYLQGVIEISQIQENGGEEHD